MIAKYNCTNYDMLDYIVENNLGNILVVRSNNVLEYLIEVLVIFIMWLSYADQINYLCHYSLLYISFM